MNLTQSEGWWNQMLPSVVTEQSHCGWCACYMTFRLVTPVVGSRVPSNLTTFRKCSWRF